MCLIFFRVSRFVGLLLFSSKYFFSANSLGGFARILGDFAQILVFIIFSASKRTIFASKKKGLYRERGGELGGIEVVWRRVKPLPLTPRRSACTYYLLEAYNQLPTPLHCDVPHTLQALKATQGL